MTWRPTTVGWSPPPVGTEAEGTSPSVARVWAAGGAAAGRRNWHWRRWEAAAVARRGRADGTQRASVARLDGARDRPSLTAPTVPGAIGSCLWALAARGPVSGCRTNRPRPVQPPLLLATASPAAAWGDWRSAAAASGRRAHHVRRDPALAPHVYLGHDWAVRSHPDGPKHASRCALVTNNRTPSTSPCGVAPLFASTGWAVQEWTRLPASGKQITHLVAIPF